MYVCECCGKESTDAKKIESCEATDLGLTIEQLQEYREMQWRAESWGAIVSRRNNQENRTGEEKAIRELLEFEKEHAIQTN